MTKARLTRTALMPILVLVILAGCGQTPEPSPPTTPSTAPTAEAGTATPATPATGGLTLGELASRVQKAWADVTSYRLTSTTEAMAAPAPATPVASSVATPGATPVVRAKSTVTFVREVVLPDLQRQEVTGLGANDHEAIATADGIFVRGPLVEQIAPNTPTETWVAVDPAHIPTESVLSQLLGGLPAAPPAPLSTLPERLWSQEVRDLGPVEFDGRDCRAYGAANTVTTTGTRLDFTIAVDDRNLPCFIETSTGGQIQGREEFTDIDADLAVSPPTQATPVSIPSSLATPISHD